ncbi:MAG: Fe-S cluster assembly protein SufD, partial [Pedosphaera parvula]|nr:Fe-S cluster assembly protein SufD [Pedosphaera parvula]
MAMTTATAAPPTMKQTDPHLAKFESFEQDGARQHPAWLFPLRKAGIARFAELGFPTVKHEDWRFTNVAPIAKLPFLPVFAASANDPTP